MPSRSRIVLLTGAAGGIGRVMTQALLRDGHCVAAVDRDADWLETPEEFMWQDGTPLQSSPI